MQAMRTNTTQWLVLILTISVCTGSWAQSPATAPSTEINSLGITVGHDTTFFTAPLSPDGSVDYVAALNDRNGRNNLPASNAECIPILIADADSRQPEDIQRRAALRLLLGMKDDPGREVVWQNWKGFEHPIPADDPDNPAHVDRFENATTQPWSSQDMPDLAAWLKTNDTALGLLTIASQRPEYWRPIVVRPGKSDLFEEPVDEDADWRNYSRALLIRAMLELHDGDASAALDDTVTVQRLASLFSQSSSLIPLLVADAMRDAGLRTSWRILQDSHLPPERLSQWSADLILGPFPRLQEQVGLRLRCDFLSMVQAMAAAETGEMLKHMTAGELRAARQAVAVLKVPVLDWNRILRYGNRYYDALLKDRSLLPSQQRDSELKSLSDWTAQIETISSNADRTGHPPAYMLPATGETRDAYSDRVGAILVAVTLPSIRHSSDVIRRDDERLPWTSLAGAALANYRTDHGEYPPTLEALIPKYLPRLPNKVLPDPIAYERRGNGYVIRHIRQYTDREKEFLAQSGQDFYSTDVVIRTDQFPK
jgi:hypothetical protein